MQPLNRDRAADDPRVQDAAGSGTLNGEPAALAVDRAIGELRRGRCIAIGEPGRYLVLAALETASAGLLDRLLAAGAPLKLLLTSDKARISGLAPDAEGPIALEIEQSAELDALKTLAGLTAQPSRTRAAAQLAPWDQADTPAALAAFRLAKAARLVPALIAWSTRTVADPSVLTVPLEAIAEHAAAASSGIQLISESRVPLQGAENSRVALFRDEHGGGEHVAVIIGEPDLSGSVPVRLHSACLTGDLLGSLRCDCGDQLKTAVARIAELGGGMLLYLDQEGRSIGLANKLRAYSIQDTGIDTFDADHHLGFSADERSYDLAAAMLQRMGVARVRLLTNNPQKIEALREHGIDVVDRLPLISPPTRHNEKYLRAKRERAGHLTDEP
jgi:GTP cyclohydrolase II